MVKKQSKSWLAGQTMSIFKSLLTLFLSLYLLFGSYTLRAAEPQNPVLKEMVPATVYIQLFDKYGSQSYFGTGFFISQDGLLLTNYHVMENMLEQGHKAIFTLNDKTVVVNFKVWRCFDSRKTDLCIIKLPVKPKKWITVSKKIDVSGMKLARIFAVGNNRVDTFIAYDNVIVTNYYKDDFRLHIKLNNEYTRNVGVKMLEVSRAGMGKGFSGGPLFDAQGNLLGISTVEIDNGRWILAIANSEVVNYVEKTLPGTIHNNLSVDGTNIFTEKTVGDRCGYSDSALFCMYGMWYLCQQPDKKEACASLTKRFDTKKIVRSSLF